MLSRLSRFFRRHRLELISFVTGFSLLTFELTAARLLAPSIGSSTYVWTSVIGVIIAALSLGFYAGGKVADARNSNLDVIWLLLLAASTTAVTLLAYDGVLETVVTMADDSRAQAVIAAVVLFAPTSFFIGMTSPYLAKLNVSSLQATGQTIAALDMFNAIGGITGTFITGFILFGYIGSHQAIGLVVALLVGVSWLVVPRYRSLERLIATAILLLLSLTPPAITGGLVKIETASAHYEVIQGVVNNRPVVGLTTGPSGTQSAVYSDDVQEPVFWYTQELSRITIARQPNSILMLGGGALTLPQQLSHKLPRSHIDVVEIDPKLKDISEDYFGYNNPPNVSEIFTDARAYINQTNKKYDLIIVDVYGDISIPFSFITSEYAKALSKRLSNDGVVLANIIGGETGPCRTAFAAVDAAYRQKFPYAYYANQSGQVETRANYIVMYSQKPQEGTSLKPLKPLGSRLFTDNFAPAERLYYHCQQAGRQD